MKIVFFLIHNIYWICVFQILPLMCQKLRLNVFELKGGGVQVYLNEGLSRFPIVDNSDIVKLYQRVFFFKHVQMKGYVLFSKGR